eukprot:5406371-Amphidinium_carterae.1
MLESLHSDMQELKRRPAVCDGREAQNISSEAEVALVLGSFECVDQLNLRVLLGVDCACLEEGFILSVSRSDTSPCVSNGQSS